MATNLIIGQQVLPCVAYAVRKSGKQTPFPSHYLITWGTQIGDVDASEYVQALSLPLTDDKALIRPLKVASNVLVGASVPLASGFVASSSFLVNAVAPNSDDETADPIVGINVIPGNPEPDPAMPAPAQLPLPS